ncbi:MAG: CTP synthase, partial [Thaumarchaeota archaeon]|nr:CTP synthase [Nitrososphaerota archaeon]
IVCRSAQPLTEKVRQKISLYCNVSQTNVISSPDTDSIYKLPNLFDEQNLAQIVAQTLRLNLPQKFSRRPPFDIFLKHLARPHRQLQIAITGKYTAVRDSYVSIINALEHSEVREDVSVKIQWIDTTAFSGQRSLDEEVLSEISGIIVPGGFGERGAEGKIRFVQYARERGIPFLGLCFGFQLAVVEFARHVCGLTRAAHAEVDPNTDTPLIYLLPEQRKIAGMGGTMRLGGQQVKIKRGTLAYRLYQKDLVVERFRHRYEFNIDYKDLVEGKGLVFSGMTPDEQIMQILELPDHPFFIATQFHPELTSRPFSPHPLFQAFVRAAKAQSLDMEAGAFQRANPVQVG